MDIVQLNSSSEDDEDMYLNSVAKLKALKKKQPSSNHTDQKNEKAAEGNQEELIAEVPQQIVKTKITRTKVNKKSTSTRRTRQRQRKTIPDCDSDLEIVSVEEKPTSSENDLSIIENNVDDSSHNNEDENYEIHVKILWRSKDVHRLNIRRNTNFRQIFEHFANLEQVPIDDILITRKDKIIKKSDSPASINLSVIDILEGGIFKKDPTSRRDTDGKPDDNACTIKVQTTNKKSVTVYVKQDENFESLLEKCAQELNIEKSKIKLYFDGELIAVSDTPDSLEIEDEACFDLRLPS